MTLDADDIARLRALLAIVGDAEVEATLLGGPLNPERIDHWTIDAVATGENVAHLIASDMARAKPVDRNLRVEAFAELIAAAINALPALLDAAEGRTQ